MKNIDYHQTGRVMATAALIILWVCSSSFAQSDLEDRTISGEGKRWYSLIRQGWQGGNKDDIRHFRSESIPGQDKHYRALLRGMGRNEVLLFYRERDGNKEYIASIRSKMYNLMGLAFTDPKFRRGFWDGIASKKAPKGTKTNFVREELLTTAGKQAYRAYYEVHRPDRELLYEVRQMIELEGGIYHFFLFRVSEPRYSPRLEDFDSMLRRLVYKY